jgi:hypothetical protein
MNMRNAAAILGLGAFLVCALLFIYFPVVPRSAIAWGALIALGLPVWFFLEWLGECVLGSSFFSRKSSAFRILLAVPVVAGLMAIAMLLVRLVQSAIVTLS